MISHFATLAVHTRGRLYPEPENHDRSPFQRDRDRIVHATAFRRLQYKTQVFVYSEGDHYRSRLTHSLEVAQITRSLCRLLGLDSDLGEAIALAHDLGHPPFGHAGEDALNEATKSWGGFNHNAQTLRVLTYLEQKYLTFDGLNLSWETLEGVVKHNGPLNPDHAPKEILEYNKRHDLELHTFSGLESQIAGLSDDIAYLSHDLEDGFRAGLVCLSDLGCLSLVRDVDQDGTLMTMVNQIDEDRTVHEIKRRLIRLFIEDVVAQTHHRLKTKFDGLEGAFIGADIIRHADVPVADFSDHLKLKISEFRDFQRQRIYKHPKIVDRTRKAKDYLKQLLMHYIEHPNHLPDRWQAKLIKSNDQHNIRLILDYTAGMTDRFAIQEYQRLIGPVTGLFDGR